jgi:hypothetical protein
VLARSSNAKSRPTTNVGEGETGLDRLFAHYGREPDPNTGALKLHTWYLGKQETAESGDPTTPAEAGEERPVDQPIQRKPAQRMLRPPRRTGEPPRGGRPAKLTP